MVLEQQTKASDDAMYRPSFQKMSEEAENLAIQLQVSGLPGKSVHHPLIVFTK